MKIDRNVRVFVFVCAAANVAIMPLYVSVISRVALDSHQSRWFVCVWVCVPCVVPSPIVCNNVNNFFFFFPPYPDFEKALLNKQKEQRGDRRWMAALFLPLLLVMCMLVSVKPFVSIWAKPYIWRACNIYSISVCASVWNRQVPENVFLRFNVNVNSLLFSRIFTETATHKERYICILNVFLILNGQPSIHSIHLVVSVREPFLRTRQPLQYQNNSKRFWRYHRTFWPSLKWANVRYLSVAFRERATWEGTIEHAHVPTRDKFMCVDIESLSFHWAKKEWKKGRKRNLLTVCAVYSGLFYTISRSLWSDCCFLLMYFFFFFKKRLRLAKIHVGWWIYDVREKEI